MRIRNAIRTSTAIIFLLLSTATFPGGLFADSWKFIVAGDSRGGDNGVNTAILGEIATEIVNQNAEFILFPGDLVNGYNNQTALESQLLTWRNTMQPVYNAGIPVYAVRGNHDVGSPAGVTAWNNVFSGAYAMPANGPVGETNLTFSATHNNAFILGLDEYTPYHQVNQTWVDAQLASNYQPHIFAFGHEPAFAVHHSDCLDDYSANRNLFWAGLAGAGGRTYFAGHDHFYDRARIDDGDGNPENDLHQYIVGTTGAPLRDWSPPYSGSNSPYTPVQEYHAKEYGYVVVEIDGPQATLTWFERTAPGVYSATTDVFSYTVALIPGDSNEDGAVDVVDLGILATNYGAASGMTWADGDFTKDGAVDLSDLGILATYYGTPTTAADMSSHAVPEPSTLACLLGLCLAGSFARVRRK